MTKLFSALLAAAFALTTLTPVAVAADMQKQETKKSVKHKSAKKSTKHKTSKKSTKKTETKK